jgi:phasin family protein
MTLHRSINILKFSGGMTSAMNAPTRKPSVAKSPDVIESVYSAAKEAMEGAFNPAAATKQLEAAAAFGRANWDAAAEAGSAWLAGAQNIGQAWLALAQESVDDGVAALRRLTACRSTPELVAAHSDIARTTYTKYARKGRALSDLAVKLAEDVSSPVVARAEAALGAFAKSTAA